MQTMAATWKVAAIKNNPFVTYADDSHSPVEPTVPLRGTVGSPSYPRSGVAWLELEELGADWS